MDIQDAMDQLGLRVEDADKKMFPEKLRREVLEYSQIKIANMLHNAYLTELEYIDASKTATAGVYALSSLTYDVLRGAEGILKVKLSGGKYCSRLDLKDLKKIENAFLDGTDDNPLYYVFQNNIYVFCTQPNPVIDIYYLRVPSPLYYSVDALHLTSTTVELPPFGDVYDDDYFNGTMFYYFEPTSYHVATDWTKTGGVLQFLPARASGTSDSGVYLIKHPTIDVELLGLSIVEFELNDSLQDLVLDYAESELWKITAQIARRNSSLEKVITQIKTLNDKYRVAESIGT